MKKQLLKLGILGVFMTLCLGIKAQTSVDFTWVVDSSSNWQHCPPPVSVNFIAAGNANGYNVTTDSIDIHAYWGDGTDTIITTPIYTGGGATDYFQSWNQLWHNYTSAGTFNVMFIATGPDGQDDTTYYPLTIYANCVQIDGYCFNDINGNCVFDSGDDTLAGVPVYVTDLSGNHIAWGYTDSTGHYSFSVPQGMNNLTIQPQIWFGSVNTITCPSAGNYMFNATSNATYNFGLTCSSSSHDLFVYGNIGFVGAPGSNGQIGLFAGNYSCSGVSGTVSLTLDPSVTYSGMITGPAPTSVTGNTLTWNHNFPASPYYWWNQSFYVLISVATDTNAVLFDSACFSASVTPLAGDIDITDNSDNWCRIIGGPYDPNNKLSEAPGMASDGSIAPQSTLTYTVNFQNTGTAPAINIYVMDTISSNLDLGTIQILGSSHDMHPYFYNGNIVRFDFPNINLPDSNANEPLSHGWVVYSIKAKTGLADGTPINNTAYIYFDYNAPIVTNTTANPIDIALGVKEAKTQVENIFYPNPATQSFTVKFENEMSGQLMVIDATGRIVKSVALNKTLSTQVNVSDLAPGLYSISIPGAELKQNRLQVIR